MTEQEMVAILEQYVDAVNRHDVDGMLELRHPRAYLELMGVAPRIQGIERLRAFYETFFGSLLPDYRLEIAGSSFGASTGVVWGHYTATVPPGFLETDSRGGSVRVPVCFVCTFVDGRFCGDHMYADALAPARQTGASVPPVAPPAPPEPAVTA